MRGKETHQEIGLLEELIRGKETIFREEIQTLEETLRQVQAQVIDQKKYVYIFYEMFWF
jgi:hypothetical protein